VFRGMSNPLLHCNASICCDTVLAEKMRCVNVKREGVLVDLIIQVAIKRVSFCPKLKSHDNVYICRGSNTRVLFFQLYYRQSHVTCQYTIVYQLC
jgi:hypothetical protein